jgi:hypothetical protein
MSVEVFQLDKIHARLVGEAPESPTQVVMGDPDSEPWESGPPRDTKEDEVSAGGGQGDQSGAFILLE